MPSTTRGSSSVAPRCARCERRLDQVDEEHECKTLAERQAEMAKRSQGWGDPPPEPKEVRGSERERADLD